MQSTRDALTAIRQHTVVERDWSEEAIVERDPSFRLGDADEYATVAQLPAHRRRELAAALIALGMPAWRASAAAEL